MKILLSTILVMLFVGCGTQAVESTGEASEADAPLQKELVVGTSSSFCDDLNGQTWQTVEQFDAGRSMNGMAKMHWTIGFDGGQFRWRYADVVEMGSFSCEDDTLELSSAMQDPRATAQYNNEQSQLIMNEKIYVLQSE